MAKQQNQATQERQALSGVERLGLRISSMINHPTAQQQRWVTVHRLDGDGDAEWREVIGVLAETDRIEMTLNNEDGSVTLAWEASSDNDLRVEGEDEFVAVGDSI